MIARSLLIGVMASVLAGCASSPPVDTKDTTVSVVFGYFDMHDAPSNLDWVSLRRYDSAKKDGEWYRLAVRDTELLFPGPIEFDIRPDDRAIYVGTLRLHRDEFHEVTQAEVFDQFPTAYVEFTKKFGDGLPLRKALLKPIRTS